MADADPQMAPQAAHKKGRKREVLGGRNKEGLQGILNRS